MPVPYHAHLSNHGRRFAFAHLEPFQMDIDSLKAGRILRVHVRFTMHCFTRGHEVATHPADEPVLHDAGGRPRMFCIVRFDLSARLPGMI